MTFTCKVCSKPFKFYRGLWRHSLIHKGVKARCSYSRTMFSRPDNLKRHQRMSQTCKSIDVVTKPLLSKPKLVDYDSLLEDDCRKDVQTSVNVHAHNATQSSFNEGDTLTIKDSEDDSPTPGCSPKPNLQKMSILKN